LGPDPALPAFTEVVTYSYRLKARHWRVLVGALLVASRKR
jgi:hypothetical protein